MRSMKQSIQQQKIFSKYLSNKGLIIPKYVRRSCKLNNINTLIMQGTQYFSKESIQIAASSKEKKKNCNHYHRGNQNHRRYHAISPVKIAIA